MTPHSPLRRIVFFIALFAAALLAFRHGINAPITLDMKMTTYNNAAVTAPDGILRAFRGDFCDGCRVDMPMIDISTGFYRPLVNAFYWMEYRIAGTDDRIYNFDQILLHWACAVTVFFFAARLLPDKPLAPFAAAALFALHPANAYAATRDVRADALCLLFYLGAIMAYLRAFAPGGPPQRGHIALALAAYLGALLSKEMGVTLPAVLAVLHLQKRYAERRPLREIGYTVPFWLLFAVYMGARAVLLGRDTFNPYMVAHAPHVLYINAVKNFPIYVLRYLLPIGADYPTLLPKMVNFIDPAFADPSIYLSLMLLLLIAGAALWNIGRRPAAAFLALFMLIAMTPLTMVTRITDITDINVINTPERFMYIPSVPLLLLIALLLNEAYHRLQTGAAKKGAAAAGTLAALFLGYQSSVHTAAITSETAVLKQLYLFPKGRLTPQMNVLRECLYAQLVAIPLQKYDEARRRLEKVVKENPAMPTPHAALGMLYLIIGQRELIPPLLERWNRLSPEEIPALVKQNPTVLTEYFGIYNHIPFLLSMAAAQGGQAREASDLLCSALRRGHSDESVISGLRENYLLNGPPRCREAEDAALCRKNAVVPHIAAWQNPLDPKKCGDWKNIY